MHKMSTEVQIKRTTNRTYFDRSKDSNGISSKCGTMAYDSLISQELLEQVQKEKQST